MRRRFRADLVSTAWGFSEAAFFFIVPDVWLSYIGRKNLKAGLAACVFALTGAVAGGGALYSYGASNPDKANRQLALLPGISHDHINAIQREMSKDAYRAMMIGPATGNPYKIYAANFHRYESSLTKFMLATVPARLIRFASVTILIHFVYAMFRRAVSERTCMIIFVAGWTVFYILYFSVKGW